MPENQAASPTTTSNQPAGDDASLISAKGPDGRTYKFPKGTSRDTMAVMIKQHMAKNPSVKQAVPSPTAGERMNMPLGSKAVGDFVQKQEQFGSDEASRQMSMALGPESQKLSLPERLGHRMAAEAAQAGRVGYEIVGSATPKNLAVMGAGLLTGGLAPAFYFAYEGAKGVKDAASDIEKHGLTPENTENYAMSGATLSGSLAGAGEGAKKIGETIGPKMLDKAAVLDTRAFKTAESKHAFKGPQDLPGQAVAQEKIITNLKNAPKKIEEARAKTAQQVDQTVAKADAGGATGDIDRALDNIVRTGFNRANERAALTSSVREQTARLLKGLRTKTDMQTGQVVPRNLSQLKPSELLALSRGLENPAGLLGGGKPETTVEVMAGQIRQLVNNELEKTAPGTQEMRAHESQLIKSRDSAAETWAKALNEQEKAVKSMWTSPTAGEFGLMTGLVGLSRMLGANTIGSLGAIIGLRSAFKSTLSRTARAALYQRAGELMTGKRPPTWQIGQPFGGNAPQAPQPQGGPQMGPMGGNAGGTPLRAAQPPQTPQPAQNTGVTGALPQQAGSPPAAPAANAAPSAMPRSTVTGNMMSPMAEAQATIARIMQEAQQKAAASPQVNLQVVEPPKAEPKAAAPSTKDAVSGLSELKKAQLDELDELYDRLASPKSGADRVAIQRMIAEKRILFDHDTPPAVVKKINKRFADRVRLREKRAQSAAMQPTEGGSAVGKSSATATSKIHTDSIAQGANPEELMIATERLYEEIGKLDPEGSKALIKNMKASAKAAKLDLAGEFQSALEVYQAMKELGGGEL